MQPEHGQKQNNESLKNLYVKTRRLIGKTPRWVFAYLSGVNPNTDKRFVKNGKSIVDALLTFHDEKTGGFRHVNKASGGFQPVVDQMATE